MKKTENLFGLNDCRQSADACTDDVSTDGMKMCYNMDKL